jgi:hypothetical protein
MCPSRTTACRLSPLEPQVAAVGPSSISSVQVGGIAFTLLAELKQLLCPIAVSLHPIAEQFVSFIVLRAAC